MNNFGVHTEGLRKIALFLAVLVAYGALGACDESPVPEFTSVPSPTASPKSTPAPTVRLTMVASSTPTRASTQTNVIRPTPTAVHTLKTTQTATRVAPPASLDDHTPTPATAPKPTPTSTPSRAVTATPTLVATGTATVEPAEVSNSDASPDDNAVQYNGVDITIGRAVLHFDGRVTVFYVAGDVDGEFDEPIVIERAEITSSDGMSWRADGHGELHYEAPLTLGWLTFPVSDAAPGNFVVTVDSAKVGRSRIAGQWQLRQLPGLAPLIVKRRNDVVNSGICVSSGNVAFGFQKGACPTEFYDMSPRRKSATPELNPTSPSPGPAPTSMPVGISVQTNPTVATDAYADDFLIFELCTPWHINLHVHFDESGTSEYTSGAPTTSFRCVLP